MPEMFNAYVKIYTENEGQDASRVSHSRQLALGAVSSFAQVCEPVFVGSLFKTLVAKWLKATTGEAPPTEAPALGDLANTLVPHLPAELLELALKVFGPALKSATPNSGSEEEKLLAANVQKAAYRAICNVIRHPAAATGGLGDAAKAQAQLANAKVSAAREAAKAAAEEKALAVALLPVSVWLNNTSQRPAGLTETGPKVLYTLAELTDLGTGQSDANTLLLGILGRVFNVSAGEEFYAKGQGYSVFAGHDCTRAFALTSTKAKWLDNGLDGVTEKQLSQLNKTYWETYVAKYAVVGKLLDPPYDPSQFDRFVGSYADFQPVPAQANGTKAAKPVRQSKCPVTRAARAIGGIIADLIPRQLLG
ncbi:unnamed protein product [Polarella glacialis]|uniref:Cytochrome b5 heme-binding domain-containing protein n=1 Tax=Polarella glacialis TaxID=89957 RepID=A0A813HXS1_POLGL|nr:unnamed protein product [Polarella glacialis]